MTGLTFSHRLEHALFLAVAQVVRRLPESWALRLGSALGWAAGSLFRIRRRVIDENLAIAFPDGSPGWRRTVAAASYRHVGREGVALLRLEAMGPAQLGERVRVDGVELVRAPLEEGRGVLILTGHLGNWEIGGAAVAALGIPLDVVARAQSNPLFDAHLRRTRERLGMRVVYRGGATRQLLRSLREPRAVALVADQNVAAGGVFVDFFGLPAATARGPALLAARTGAEVVAAHVHRIPGPVARYRLRFVPVSFERGGGPEEDLRRLTRAYLQTLEEAIREAPEQYFWLHRRWKTRPEAQEPPPAGEVSASLREPGAPTSEDRS